ncbi:MAG: glycosyltransferase family 39 protein [Pyrinomonadaceae bacterium]
MKERTTVFLLFLSALAFRVIHYVLFSNDLVVGGDQMQNILLARKFASGDIYGVLHTYWTPLYPLLIGVVSVVIDSLVTPSLILSILSGSLAAPVVYYFVKQSYGAREGLIAGAISIFYPHLINSFFWLGTENIFLVIITGALIVGWKALVEDRIAYYALNGALVGAAYLTRPEGIGYIGYFALLVLGRSLWVRPFSGTNLLLRVGALFLGFFILAAPYLYYLRSETGAWTVSAKSDVNFASGIYSEGAQEYVDEYDSIPKVFAYNLFEIHKAFPYLFPPLLMILVALGLFGERWDRERFWREGYLILFFLMTLAGYAITVVQTRYLFVLLPILFGWSACGVVQLQKWLHGSIENWWPGKGNLAEARLFVPVCLALMYLYVMPLNSFLQSSEKAWQTLAYEERDAGLWLKQNSEQSPLVFSASLRPVFYAEAKQLTPKSSDSAEVLYQIHNCSVDYVITGERSLKRNPYLKDLPDALLSSPNFKLVYEENVYPGYKISIFKRN